MWKKDVRAILVTGDRTCCRAWITFTRNASTAFLPISSLYTLDINTSPLWLYTNNPPIILSAPLRRNWRTDFSSRQPHWNWYWLWTSWFGCTQSFNNHPSAKFHVLNMFPAAKYASLDSLALTLGKFIGFWHLTGSWWENVIDWKCLKAHTRANKRSWSLSHRGSHRARLNNFSLNKCVIFTWLQVFYNFVMYYVIVHTSAYSLKLKKHIHLYRDQWYTYLSQL